MSKEFKLPELGENVESGTIVNVLVSEGDTVDKDQPILEIETDKAVVEIPSPYAGTVKSLKVSAGQKVSVGQVIFVVEEGDGGNGKQVEAEAEEAPKKKEEKPPAREEKPKPEPAKVEASKAEDGDDNGGKRPNLQLLEPAGKAVRRSGPVVAAPSVRRMAREMGVDLNKVPTADPSGRVTVEDIRNFAQAGRRATANSGTAASAAAAPAPAEGTSVGEDKWGSVLREPMSGIRRKTAAFMTECWSTIPHVTHHDKADITSIEALRKKHGRKIEAAGGKLTVTSFIVKLLASALQRFPKFNASIDLDAEELVYRQYYHIGVAVDTEHGLLVPVLRDADRLSVADISTMLPEMAKKARDRKLALEDMQGGTFTVSNLGGFGGNGFTPIISAPQVAILGVSRASIEPVYTDGVLAPRLMLPLSLSYDHRVIDGADAARFLRWFAEALEQPWLLYLDN